MTSAIATVAVVIAGVLAAGIGSARSAAGQGKNLVDFRQRWLRIGLQMLAGLILLCLIGYFSRLDGAAGAVVLIGGGLVFLILAPLTIAILVFVLGLFLGARTVASQPDSA